MSDLSRSEVAHQIKYEQDNEHKAEAAAAADMSSISISAATEEKNKDNNNENQGHGNILYWGKIYRPAFATGRVRCVVMSGLDSGALVAELVVKNLERDVLVSGIVLRPDYFESEGKGRETRQGESIRALS